MANRIGMRWLCVGRLLLGGLALVSGLCSFNAELGAALEGPERIVDIVFTWVDAGDEEWVRSRNKWAKKEGGGLIGADAHDESRFRDNGELRYALRSVHKNAPFVRHIFIVTSEGRGPAWLRDHPQIRVVSHRKIFRNKKYLPTFNSHAIESNLHRIPELAEHYIYMNDDFFLGQKVRYEDFYSENGKKIKVFFSKKRPLSATGPTLRDTGWRAANKNTALLLKTEFGKKNWYPHSHTPFPAIKSLVSRIEKQFPYVFTKNSSHRFRSLGDYTVTNGLIPCIAQEWGCAEPGTTSNRTINFGKDYVEDVAALHAFMPNPPTFFCLNDSPTGVDPRSRELILTFLKILFPDSAPWEKGEDG